MDADTGSRDSYKPPRRDSWESSRTSPHISFAAKMETARRRAAERRKGAGGRRGASVIDGDVARARAAP